MGSIPGSYMRVPYMQAIAKSERVICQWTEFHAALTRTAPLRAHSDFDDFYMVGKATSWRSGM